MLAGAWMAVTAWRGRAEPGVSRRFWVWGLGSIALAVLLWLPPVIQQLTGSPANFSILWDYFTQAPQQTIGIGEAVRLLLRHLNPVTLFSNDDGMTGSVVPGVVVGLIWLAGVWVAWRLRARDLLRLDLVLAVAGVLGIFSAARIFGYVWFYLVLWSWGIAALMLLTIGWTVVLALARRPWDGRDPRRAAAWLAVGLAIVAVSGTVAFTVDASDAVAPDAQPTRVFRHLIGPTVASLKAGKLPGTGPDGRYMVTFTDALNIGANAYGLVLELERQGLDAGLPTREVIIPNRKITPDDATAVVHLAVGPANIALARQAERARGRVLRPAHPAAEGRVRAAARRGGAAVQGRGPDHAGARGRQQPLRRDLPARPSGGAQADPGADARARSAIGDLRRPAADRPGRQLIGAAPVGGQLEGRATDSTEVPNGIDTRPTSDRSNRVRTIAASSISGELRSRPELGAFELEELRVSHTGATSQLKTCVRNSGSKSRPRSSARLSASRE